MDKLEYIPGDLVSVYVGIKKFIVKVIGVENENEVLSYQIKFPNGEIQYADNGNIVPIHLTTEILVKNGWKNEMYHDWRYYMTIERNILYLSEGVGIDGAFSVCVGQDMSHIADISFVHQLQHLLFGLELNSEMEV
mgnify:CR=1 FL=1